MYKRTLERKLRYSHETEHIFLRDGNIWVVQFYVLGYIELLGLYKIFLFQMSYKKALEVS